jgi:hypothetical protein
MASQAFTRNHSDHSNDTGFQFEFFCDKCGSGHRSAFKANKLGVAANLIKAAGSIFGGGLHSAVGARITSKTRSAARRGTTPSKRRSKRVGRDSTNARAAANGFAPRCAGITRAACVKAARPTSASKRRPFRPKSRSSKRGRRHAPVTSYAATMSRAKPRWLPHAASVRQSSPPEPSSAPNAARLPPRARSPPDPSSVHTAAAHSSPARAFAPPAEEKSPRTLCSRPRGKHFEG